MPTALYSWRAMSPKRCTRAASPMVEPQSLGPLGEGPGAYAGGVGIMGEWLRGSVLTVMGMLEPPFQQGLQPVVVVGDGRRIPRHPSDVGILDAILAQHLSMAVRLTRPSQASSTRVPCIIRPASGQESLPVRSRPAHGAKSASLRRGSGCRCCRDPLELQAILLDQADGAVAQRRVVPAWGGVSFIAPCQQQALMAWASDGFGESEWCFIIVIFLGVCRSGHSMQKWSAP